MRWLIIIAILGAAYLATSFTTYAAPTPIRIGTFDPIEFWLPAIWFGDQAVPFASISGFALVWLALRMRSELDHERDFRERQRELGISGTET